MSNDQVRPKADPPITLEQQALGLKSRMQCLQDEVAALLDEFAAAELQVIFNIAGPPTQAKHTIAIEVIKRF